jgi:hypothetical protein
MAEFKTIFGTYTYFNEIPVHSVFIWGDGLKFIKLADAIPDVGMSKQPSNCFNLQKQTYCTMTAKHRVKLVKQIADYDTEVD